MYSVVIGMIRFSLRFQLRRPVLLGALTPQYPDDRSRAARQGVAPVSPAPAQGTP
jgi:hypothetical protein